MPFFSSIGGPEILLIFIVALIVFGPKRLPEIGQKVGGLVRELRKSTGEFRANIEREIGIDPITGLESTRRARRELLSTVSDPIREVAQGTMEAARSAREEAHEALRTVGKVGPRTRQQAIHASEREPGPESPGPRPPAPDSPGPRSPSPDSPGPTTPGPESPGPESSPDPESPGPESPPDPESGPGSPGRKSPDQESPGPNTGGTVSPGGPTE